LQGDQKKMQGSVSRYAAGAITEELRGINAALTTGLKTVRTVDAVTHNLLTQQTGPGSTPTTVQNLAYRWDAVGNLTERQDVRAALTETFSYDNLHRLDTAALNGTTNLDMTYNSLGNITNRSDVGAYTYDPTKIHAVKTLDGGSAFAYDGNGSATTVPEVGTMSWFTTGLLKSVSDGGSFSSTFAYTPQGQRYAQTATFDGGTQSTQYIGGILEKVTEGALTQWKHYIAGPTSTVALYIRNSSGTPSTQLFTLTQDHLGSIDTILKDTGAIEVRLAYDAYGDRRNPTTGSGEPTQSEWDKIYATTHRGYTEHEHLDDFQMLHMNGRILDSLSGRVLSADPFIPNPRSTQDYNRYSYVNNNPLRYTDPSGFKKVCHTVREPVVPKPPPPRGQIFVVDLDNDRRSFSTQEVVVRSKPIIEYRTREVCVDVPDQAQMGDQDRQRAESEANAVQEETQSQQEPDRFEKLTQCASDQLGLSDLAALGAVAAGQPIPGTKPFVTPGSSRGTSLAGMAADEIFGDMKFPVRVPTIVGGPGTGRSLAIAGTRSVARFSARAVPVIGWAVLAYDAVSIGVCTFSDGGN
jgi:RHS repeat-associated protein